MRGTFFLRTMTATSSAISAFSERHLLVGSLGQPRPLGSYSPRVIFLKRLIFVPERTPPER